MSWSWKEEDEPVKTYEQNGTVTISTEEYRDLIKTAFALRVAGQKEHDDWYKEYNRAIELEKKLQTAEKKIAEVNEWLSCNSLAADDFKAWKLQRIVDQNVED